MAGPVGALLIALGCLALLAAVRQSSRSRAVPASSSGSSPGRSRLLARAVASLPARTRWCAGWVGEDGVRARLAGTGPPSPPWRAEPDGTWSVVVGDLGSADVGEPRPGLFRLGGTADHDLVVDLGGAPGLVAVGGDPAAARAAVLSGVRDLLARTRPSAVEVSTVERDLDDVLAALPAPAPASGALAGRVAPPRSGRLRLLVLWHPPQPDQVRRLHALVEDRSAGVAAICVGDTVHARWRVTVDRGGRVDLGILGAVPQGSA